MSVRAVAAVAPTQREAEEQVLQQAPHMRVLRSREINLSGPAALLGRDLGRHWAVVVADPCSEEEEREPGEPSPEEVCERNTQVTWLRLAADPHRVMTGEILQFPCPACEKTIDLMLPAPADPPKAVNRQCPHCRTPITRPSGALLWEVLESTSTPPGPCIFDGVVDDSHEHAIPEWVGKNLGIKEMMPVEDANVYPGPNRRRHPISFARHTTQAFCADCNEQFGHLEQEVSPILEEMARGHDVELDKSVQQRLALWANKTAFALRAAENKADLPFAADQLQAVRGGDVAPRTQVGFFTWAGGPKIATGTGRIVGPPAQLVYFAILTFGQLGFHVVAVADPLTPDQQLAAEINGVAQFWPPKYPTLPWPWPPMEDRLIPRLMEAVPVRPA